MRYPSTSLNRRPGVVLLVVMAMLALFASVALGFVFYADAEAEASRFYTNSMTKDQADIDPELLAAYFLGQHLYDTTNVYSAARGWSLARSLYGYNPATLNYIPYNGVGRSALAYNDPLYGDNFVAINYQKFFDPAQASNFERTPEFTGKLVNGNPDPAANAPPYRYAGGANPPWTNYDTNNLWLAQVAADGTVFTPSYYRPWLGSATRYTSLRPDSSWNPGFVTPDSDNIGGPDARGLLQGPDVRNLEFGPGSYRSVLVASAVEAASGNTVTITTSSTHGFTAGKNVTIGRVGPGYDGTFLILSTPTANTFTYTAAASGLLPAPPGGLAASLAYTNDSYWMDLGFPAMTAPNGKRYRPLFAPLVVDLSNRLHLWAHGNRVAVGAAMRHASNQGFGPTEVNLSLLPGVTAADLQSIFNLKYGGPNGTIISVAVPPAGAPANYPNWGPGSWFSNIDANGLTPKATTTLPANLSSRPFFTGVQTQGTFAAAIPNPVPAAGALVTVNVTGPTQGVMGGFPWYFFDAISVNSALTVDGEVVTVTKVTEPTSFEARFFQSHAGAVPPLQIGLNVGFPIFPSSGGWDNTGNLELTNNPLLLNLFNPVGPNALALPTSNMEALLRFGGTNSPALTSELWRRMPTTFSNVRARNMVTLANWHFDRITAAPFLNFDRTTPGHYTYNAANKYPTQVAGNNPPVNFTAANAAPGAAVTTNSEFSLDWRSNLGNFLRVDLNRKLTDFPGAQALPDRQQFASDIYNALIRATGASDPNVVIGMAQASPDYQAARWLAQLAVNIVDYIDNDNFITPFNWCPAAAAPEGWVYGTELPGLVMNEVYAQHETTQGGRVNVWAELLNPLAQGELRASQPVPALVPSTTLPLQGATILQSNLGACYQIEVYETTATLTAWLRDPANSQGTGIPVPATVPPTQPLVTLSNWIPTLPSGQPALTAPVLKVATQVLPVNSATSGTPNVVTLSNAISPYTATSTAGASAPGATVTINTTAALTGLAPGMAVTITGVNDMTGNTPITGYQGTFTVVTVGPGNKFTYNLPVAPSPALANGGGGNVTYVTNGNAGYYVVGPDGARYSNNAAGAARVPNLPVTLATPALSIAPPSVVISQINAANVAMTGASAVGNTVTIQTTVPLPAGFVTGAKVSISGVKTTDATGKIVTTPYNNSAAGNPSFWTITGVTANSFTFNYTGTTALPTTASGSDPTMGKTQATASLSPQNITLLLRRLANPSLAPGAGNPYITVDYLDNITVNQASLPAGSPLTIGRPQPYVAASTLLLPAAQNTFFRQNAGGGAAFDWLVHLDRPPVNPIELMHVSCYKPHELTQQFLTGAAGAPKKFQHNKPWRDANALIYRALDQMSSHYMAGTYTGGRFPGNINLNTLLEPEIFQALCDAHDTPGQYPNPWFTQADVISVFTKLTAARGAPSNGPPSGEGAPFKSFSAGNLTDTWMRTNRFAVPSNPDWTTNTSYPVATVVNFNGANYRSLQLHVSDVTNMPTSANGPMYWATNPSNLHPYLRNSLLQKIYNNITTTSNVFAVWWTVGYFEVVDESVQPPRLGAEIGRAQNRQIRHRFFAIVDRSGMQLFNAPSKTDVPVGPGPMTVDVASLSNASGAAVTWNATQNYSIGNAVVAPGGAYLCIQPNRGTAPPNLVNWQPILQPGMMLEIDSGTPNAEVVSVLNVIPGNTFTANFTKPHAAGATVVCRGNPGPQSNYNPRRDTSVVLHMSVIK